MNEVDLDRRLAQIESGLTRTEAALAKLTEAMVEVARLEVRLTHNGQAVERAFDSIKELARKLEHHIDTADTRIHALEEVQPVQKLVSGWVLAWIAGAVGILCGALAMKVLG